jgi:hypothetical protein
MIEELNQKIDANFMILSKRIISLEKKIWNFAKWFIVVWVIAGIFSFAISAQVQINIESTNTRMDSLYIEFIHTVVRLDSGLSSRDMRYYDDQEEFKDWVREYWKK